MVMRSLGADLELLRADFTQAADLVRVLMLVSPT
jgi:hypothetical protein